ncbi:MAG: hypothetical protein ACJA1A_000319 [Saprospiraceae bacterium]
MQHGQPVKAVTKGGKAIPVNVYLEHGTSVPLFAIYEAGNDHFMDIKGVHNGEEISIKLIITNDVLIPVKGISASGDSLKVKAEDPNGITLDVKGISRDGNTINIAAVNENGKIIPLKAISPAGVERDVKGVKFMRENDDGILLSGIDEDGRLYEVRAKTKNGESFIVIGGKIEGNVIPVFVLGAGWQKFSCKSHFLYGA